MHTCTHSTIMVDATVDAGSIGGAVQPPGACDAARVLGAGVGAAMGCGGLACVCVCVCVFWIDVGCVCVLRDWMYIGCAFSRLCCMCERELFDSRTRETDLWSGQ